MECVEARRLIDAGIVSGSHQAAQAQLGFHLARCVACRNYQAATRLPTLAAHSPMYTGSPRQSALSWAMLVVAGALLLAVFLLVGPVVRSLFTIHENVRAMVVAPSPEPTVIATEAPTATSTPLPPTPTATPLPSATATLVPTVTLTPTPAPPDPGGPVTIALLGSDRRPGEAGSARADAIIVVRLDPAQQRVALLSLPRDLYVRIPGHGSGRINGATAFARDDIEAGAAKARDTISNLLGIPVDYFVTVDFAGFIDAIDAVGGVTVDVPKELYDSKFPTMDYGYAKVYFPTGQQLLDGQAALTYSRIRHPDSDFARMRRQQAVLVALLARLRDDNILSNLNEIEATTTELREYVYTDLPETRMLGLAWALRDITPEMVERHVMEVSMVSFGVGNDRWAEQARPGAIDTLVARLLGQ